MAKGVKKTKGYFSEIDINEEDGEFIKRFDRRKIEKSNLVKETPDEVFEEEVSSIRKLNEINQELVQTPEIIKTDKKNLVIKQKYFKGTNFYAYLIKNCNKLYFKEKKLKRIFEAFGKFLGELHEKNIYGYNKEGTPLTQLHGDLSSHNLMFTKKGKLFVYDPSTKNGSVYKDVAKFLINLYLINPFIAPLLYKKGLAELKDEFLRGYEKKTSFKIERNILRKRVLVQMGNERNRRLSDNMIYKIKKKIMGYQNKKIFRSIKKGKIKI